MLMLASTVITLLENILAKYIGCKAIIPVVFSGDVYSRVGIKMRINSGCIQEYHVKVDLCDGALAMSSYWKVCDDRAVDSEYIGDDSVLQCRGNELVRRDVRVSARLKINGDSGRRFKVKIRCKKSSVSVFGDSFVSRLIS